jgi:hypothetical protein
LGAWILAPEHEKRSALATAELAHLTVKLGGEVRAGVSLHITADGEMVVPHEVQGAVEDDVPARLGKILSEPGLVLPHAGL